MKITRLAIALAIAGFASSAFAQDQQQAVAPTVTVTPPVSAFTVGTGLDYSSGDYGTSTTTEILSVPFNARYRTGNWTFKGSIPWLRITGNPNVVPGVGATSTITGRGRGIGATVGTTTPTTTTAPASTSASGMGDLSLAATYSFNTGSPLGIDLTGNAKIATADEKKGLGTGANDYGVAVDLYRDFSGTTLFGGLNYTRLGKSVYVTRRGVAGANVGLSHALAFGSIGASYDYRQSANSQSSTVAGSNFGEPRSELTGFYSFPAGQHGKFQLYAMAGLAKGSPDWGGGLSYGYTF